MTGAAADLEASISSNFKMSAAVLTGRKYLFIRGIEGENGMAQQAVIAKDFYECVDDLSLD